MCAEAAWAQTPQTPAAPAAPAGAPPPTAAAAPAAAAPQLSITAASPDASAGAGAATPAAGSTTNQEILASPEVLEKARQHFKQGVAFAAAGNCDGAVVEFEAAYNIIPRPNALYNIAQCEERLFRYDLAIDFYKRYMKEAPPDAEDRPAVDAALKTLGNLLGVVHIKVAVKSDVWIDDRLGGTAPGDVYVPAGGHSLEIRAEGYLPRRMEVRLVGHEEVTLSVQLEQAQTNINVTETTGISPALFWIGASATLISASIGGLSALHVGSLYDEAKKIPKFSPERNSKKNDMQSAELTADVFFATAGALAIGTTIVAFMTEWTPPDETPAAAAKASAKLHFTPVASPNYAGFVLHGGL